MFLRVVMLLKWNENHILTKKYVFGGSFQCGGEVNITRAIFTYAEGDEYITVTSKKMSFLVSIAY